MVRFRFSSLIVAAGALGCAVGMPLLAHADDTVAAQKPFRLMVGAFFPASSDVRSLIGSTAFSAGASWDINKTKDTAPILSSVYADYAGQSKNVEGINVRLSYWAVGLQARKLLAPAMSAAQPYVGLGLGYYNVTFKASAFDGSGDLVSASDTEGRIGGKVFVGYQLNAGFFGEAGYTYISSIDGTDPSGYNLRVGYRF